MDVAVKASEVAQAMMADKAFINYAIEEAAKNDAFKNALKDTLGDVFDNQDVVVVINEAAEPQRGASIVNVENGVKLLAIVGVAATVYVGFNYGAKMVDKFRK
jgi:DhnA family fructose-bisphosphate aldolase class Ia